MPPPRRRVWFSCGIWRGYRQVCSFEGVSPYGLVSAFCSRQDNDLGFRLCIDEVAQFQDGGVHPSRVNGEGCNGGVGVGLC